MLADSWSRWWLLVPEVTGFAWADVAAHCRLAIGLCGLLSLSLLVCLFTSRHRRTCGARVAVSSSPTSRPFSSAATATPPGTLSAAVRGSWLPLALVSGGAWLLLVGAACDYAGRVLSPSMHEIAGCVEVAHRIEGPRWARAALGAAIGGTLLVMLGLASAAAAAGPGGGGRWRGRRRILPSATTSTTQPSSPKWSHPSSWQSSRRARDACAAAEVGAKVAETSLFVPPTPPEERITCPEAAKPPLPALAQATVDESAAARGAVKAPPRRGVWSHGLQCAWINGLLLCCLIGGGCVRLLQLAREAPTYAMFRSELVDKWGLHDATAPVLVGEFGNGVVAAADAKNAGELAMLEYWQHMTRFLREEVCAAAG